MGLQRELSWRRYWRVPYNQHTVNLCAGIFSFLLLSCLDDTKNFSCPQEFFFFFACIFTFSFFHTSYGHSAIPAYRVMMIRKQYLFKTFIIQPATLSLVFLRSRQECERVHHSKFMYVHIYIYILQLPILRAVLSSAGVCESSEDPV